MVFFYAKNVPFYLFQFKKSTMETNDEVIMLVPTITNKMEEIVVSLQKSAPEKEFSLTIYEPNRYWCINWKSTKLWKTERFLKESIQLRMFLDNEKISVTGYHRIEDIFEQLEDTYFRYEEKTVAEIFDMLDLITTQTKYAILKAVNQEFDSDY